MTTESNPPAETPQRPENVPEQFWNAETGAVDTESLLAAYAASQTPADPPADPVDDTPADPVDDTPADPADDTPADPEDAPSPYDAAVQKAAEELAGESGVLSEETYEKFAEAGVPRETVDEHVEGQKAKFELRKMYAERESGGEEAYSAMLEWAGSNYTPEQAEAFNAAVFGADKDGAMQAVRELKSKYEGYMGNDGKIVTDGNSASGSGGYASRDEWMADLRKPEYKTNQSFREGVRKKLEASMRSGVNMGIGASAR